MTRAEERALEAYNDMFHNPEKMSVRSTISPEEVAESNFDYKEPFKAFFLDVYQQGYEQAEKDTIERAVAWLKDNANKYIVDLTETYPDAPVNIIVGGMCWEDLTKYLKDNEQISQSSDSL